MRKRLLYIISCCFFLHSGIAKVLAQEIGVTKGLRISAERDSVKPIMDSITIKALVPVLDTVRLDTVENDTLKPQFLTDIVTYTAQDYMRLSPKENKMYLYDQAEITYGDINITAGLIIIDNDKSEVYAFGIPDSTGAYSQKPIFTQASNVVKPDSIRFNFDTERALIYNSRTTEGEFNVMGEVTKRENDSVYFMSNVKFTTSEDLENPDYYFYARRIKFVPDEKIVSGLVNMYIADVPLPVGLPFGYFPLTDEQTSGFIVPSFGEDNRRGYYLQGGGYYFAINDYMDLTVLGDYYTNGSYGLNLASTYAVRYKFRGNLRFRYEKLITSERGFPDYSVGSIYNIQWSHSQDRKASPTSTFSASVNLGSSNYYQASTNQINAGNRLTNTLSSSVSYSKLFPGDPEINISIAARHSQNTNTRQITMTLPTIDAGMSRIYPFKPKIGTKQGIVENINFRYTFRAENRFNTTDSLFFTSQMFEDAIMGAQHSVPISTNFKLFNYLNVSASTNYNETWVFKTFDRSYDEELQEEVVDTIKGFDAYRTYNFSTGIGTTLYGIMNFGKNSKIQAVRHVMRPSISYNINPGFEQYYDEYVVPGTAAGQEERIVEYSRFQGSLYGPPGNNFSSSIGFSLSNTFEAKIKKKDTIKKIGLLNNFNIRTAYNLSGDSLKLAPINISGNIPIVQDKLDINFGANLDIYALNNNNQRINTLNINNGGSLFRLTNAQASFGYSFSSKDFSGEEKEEEEEEEDEDRDRLENDTFRNGGRRDDLFGKGMDRDGTFEDDEDEDEQREKSELYNFTIPWDLRLAYTVSYGNRTRENEISNHSLMFSGNVELSPRWSLGASSGYDFVNQGFTLTQLRFSRDLESWRMSFNWTPFGRYKSWNFFIGIKSSMLSDIKYEKRRRRDRQL